MPRSEILRSHRALISLIGSVFAPASGPTRAALALAETVQARQPPVGTRRGSSQHRLKLIYMAQIGERPPRFAIQINSRARVTRDYAYFVENRLRARYGMDGVPLVIDFVERGQRGRELPTRPPREDAAKRARAGNSSVS